MHSDGWELMHDRNREEEREGEERAAREKTREGERGRERES